MTVAAGGQGGHADAKMVEKYCEFEACKSIALVRRLAETMAYFDRATMVLTVSDLTHSWRCVRALSWTRQMDPAQAICGETDESILLHVWRANIRRWGFALLRFRQSHVMPYIDIVIVAIRVGHDDHFPRRHDFKFEGDKKDEKRQK
jgi:hypothetical protein